MMRDVKLDQAAWRERCDEIEYREPDVDAIVTFLCEDRLFARERVTGALTRAFILARWF
jgi:hypothetical protein